MHIAKETIYPLLQPVLFIILSYSIFTPAGITNTIYQGGVFFFIGLLVLAFYRLIAIILKENRAVCSFLLYFIKGTFLFWPAYLIAGSSSSYVLGNDALFNFNKFSDPQFEQIFYLSYLMVMVLDMAILPLSKSFSKNTYLVGLINRSFSLNGIPLYSFLKDENESKDVVDMHHVTSFGTFLLIVAVAIFLFLLVIFNQMMGLKVTDYFFLSATYVFLVVVISLCMINVFHSMYSISYMKKSKL